VSWRHDGPCADPAATLEAAVGSALGMSAATEQRALAV
jgi:hypothetical protein